MRSRLSLGDTTTTNSPPRPIPRPHSHHNAERFLLLNPVSIRSLSDVRRISSTQEDSVQLMSGEEWANSQIINLTIKVCLNTNLMYVDLVNRQCLFRWKCIFFSYLYFMWMCRSQNITNCWNIWQSTVDCCISLTFVLPS